MNNRILIVLLFVTVIAVLAAGVVMVRQQAELGMGSEGVALFPDLGDRLDRVGGFDIQSSEGRVTLRREGDAWVVASKHGYRADTTEVRRALLEFARMERIEPRTGDRNLHGRLGLTDVDDPESRATRVTVSDLGGAPLAAVLIGHRAPGQGVYGREPASRGADRAFVRLVGDDQSWLAASVPEAIMDWTEWVDPAVPSLPFERIKRVTVTHPDGTVVAIYRERPGDTDFRIRDLSEGRVAHARQGPVETASALAFVTFDDVQPARAQRDAQEGASETVFTTFDGLEVTVRIRDGWARFSAEYSMAVAEEFSEAPSGTPEDPSYGGAEVLPSSPPDGDAEAARLNNRYGGWEYKLPTYKVGDLTPTIEDLTRPADETGPAVETGR